MAEQLPPDHPDLEQLLIDKRKLQRRISLLEQQLAAYADHSRNLQEYLDLFLNHPVYKVYRFFKRLLIGNGQLHAPSGEEPNFETFQILYEPNAHQLKQQKRIARQWSNSPLFEIVTAVFNPPLEVLEATAGSIADQTNENWIWNIVDASSDDQIRNFLTELANRDNRIQVERLPENRGISENLNVALRKTKGNYIAFLDHDDMLAPNALFAVAELINNHPDADFIYSDADKLNEKGKRCDPLFKPNWSPETMLSCNLLNQISVFRRNLLESIGYLNPELDGAQDWDFYLRIIEQTNRIYHIPQFLYHWRKTQHSTAQATENKPYVRTAQLAAITAHLKRSGLKDPEAFFLPNHFIHATHPLVRWTPSRNRKVSIVIPTFDNRDILRRCLNSILCKTDYDQFEIILVDTGSKEPETRQLYDEYAKKLPLRVVNYTETFNFSKACNFGARACTSELILFLNNDTEILHSDWLELMVQWFDVKEIGIVGAKLLYSTGEIQHAGVIIGLGGIASHLFLEMKENTDTLYGSDGWYRNLSAVTGACMMISREIFDSVGGFDPLYLLNYSDVDLCWKVRQKGFRILYTPHVRLIHHEAVTHKGVVPRADFERAYKQLQPLLLQGDPSFHSMLSWKHAIPRMRFNQEETSASVNTRLMESLPSNELIFLPEDLRPEFKKSAED